MRTLGPSVGDFFQRTIPQPVLDVVLGRKLLSLIIVSIIFGYLLNHIGETGKRIAVSIEHLNDWILRLLVILMHFMPIGVFCLTAQSFAASGAGMFSILAKYVFVLLFILLLHLTIISTVLLRLLSGLSIKIFFKKMWAALLLAASTASSNVALPVTLDTVQRKLGVSQPVASFTVPLGTTLNMDGGAIFQGLTTVFIAHYYLIDLAMMDYFMIIVASLVATVGTAGVPSAGPVLLVFVLQWVGLPLEGVGLILGVDRLMEMFRTAVNVSGDAMVACVVAKSENALDENIYNSSKPVDEVLTCPEINEST